MRESVDRWTSPSQSRATTAAIGVVLLIGVTVVVSVTVGTTLVGGTVDSTAEPTPSAVIELSADGETLRFSHTHGDQLAVETITIRISVDGEPLEFQPPVPFFAAEGFESGPTGPFNPSGETEWRVGEQASLTIAATNSPQPAPGDTVSVRIQTTDGLIAETETTLS